MPEMRYNQEIGEKMLGVMENAPVIKGYTAKQLAEITGKPVSEVRKELDIMQGEGRVNVHKIGSKKVYELDRLQKLINEALEGAPQIEGFSLERFEPQAEPPWPTTKWSDVFEVTGAKVYHLKKKNDN